MMLTEKRPCQTLVPTGGEGNAPGELWTWDLSFISARLEREMNWSREFTKLVEREYRRFIALTVIEPAETLGMQGPVDEFWHRHILFTRDYHRFCSKVAHGYIHHSPHEADGGESEGTYLRTLALLERHFGEACDTVWPEDSGGNCDSCASCDKVGELSTLASR